MVRVATTMNGGNAECPYYRQMEPVSGTECPQLVITRSLDAHGYESDCLFAITHTLTGFAIIDRLWDIELAQCLANILATIFHWDKVFSREDARYQLSRMPEEIREWLLSSSRYDGESN